MALRASYYGVKRNLKDELKKLDGIIPAGASVSNPLATQDEIDDLWVANGILGAKNLIVQNAIVGRTHQDVVFTVNSDGSVTANGTNNQPSDEARPNVNSFTLKKGSYIFSCKNATSDYYGFVYNVATSTRAATADSDGDFSFTLANDSTVDVFVSVKGGKTVDNVTLYPMIRLASDTDKTYRPYAMNNSELTYKVSSKQLLSTDDLNDIENEGSYWWGSYYPVNSPDNQTYGAMNVYVCSDVIHQEIIRASGSGGLIYIRRKQSNSWGSWYKFTGTEVTPAQTTATTIPDGNRSIPEEDLEPEATTKKRTTKKTTVKEGE